MKLVSKPPSRHLVRTQGKLKLTEKGKQNIYIFLGFLIVFFNIPQCTSHQQISMAGVGRSVNNEPPSISLCLQNLYSLNFRYVRGCSPAPPPSPNLDAPMLMWAVHVNSVGDISTVIHKKL
jgi:hypothetical protein